MQTILETAVVILQEFIALFVDFWPLLALLVVLHLLYALWIMSRRRKAEGALETAADDLPKTTRAQKNIEKTKAREQKREADTALAQQKPAKTKKKRDELELVEVDLRPVIVYRKAAEKPAPAPPAAPPPVEVDEQEPAQSGDSSLIHEPVNSFGTDKDNVSGPIKPPSNAGARTEAPADIPSPAPLEFPELLPLLDSDLANDLLQDFRDWGCRLEEVVYQGRFGADLVVSRPGLRVLVHIKEWKKKIGENVVQEVAGYRYTHRCDLAIIINFAGFDRGAEKAAGNKGILLWNKRELARQRKKPTALGDVAAAKS